MKIPTTVIKEYLFEKFTDYTVTVDEFITKSLFYNDRKQHMSINMETGLWQCFKTKESGDFIQLVSLCDEISYDEAFKFVGKKLISDPSSLLMPPRKKQVAISSPNNVKEEFVNFKPLSEISTKSPSISALIAKRFVKNRKLPENRFYFASSGKYANRLVIPYEDDKGFFYFQARQMIESGMKYLNPTYKNHGVKSSEVLYPCSSNMSYVVLTEGPLDAITLQESGVNATSIQGSFLSRHQLLELKRSFKNIVFSFDNDDAGREGLRKSLHLSKKLNMPSPYVVQPPERFKDWNDFYVSASKKDIRNFVNENVQKLDYKYQITSRLRGIGHS